MYTCIHAYIHTYIHVPIPIHVHIHIHIRIHIHIHTYTYTYIQEVISQHAANRMTKIRLETIQKLPIGSKGKTAAEPAPSSQPRKKAKFSVEHSRSQIMCRTGLRGPGQSHAIPFGKGTPYKNAEAAKVKAREWVAEHS